MKHFVKEEERKLDSVRREREASISIIEEVVKKAFSNKSTFNYIGVRMYGSQASGLAIASSDIDLAVTGLNLQGKRDQHIKLDGK